MVTQREHTGDQSGEERLFGEISVVLLEVSLAGAGELDGSKLESTLLEAGDDRADQSALDTIRLDAGLVLGIICNIAMWRWDIRNETV